ncbi:MAG: F0F1 ATP synthase subunit B [Bradymonadaceae bacterium]
MGIDWWTLALQVVNFGVLVWLLYYFLYQPVMDVIGRRQQKADAQLDEAERQRQQAEQERSELEEQRQQFERERDEQLERVRQQAEQRRDEIVEEGRREAEAIKESARRQIERERDESLRELREKIARMATHLAGRLLREVTGTDSTGRFLDEISERLDAMDADEKRSVREGAREDGRVEMVTGAELDDATRDQWRRRLREVVGESAEVVFSIDDSLIAGARIELPGGARVTYNWREVLEWTEEELRTDSERP